MSRPCRGKNGKYKLGMERRLSRVEGIIYVLVTLSAAQTVGLIELLRR